MPRLRRFFLAAALAAAALVPTATPASACTVTARVQDDQVLWVCANGEFGACPADEIAVLFDVPPEGGGGPIGQFYYCTVTPPLPIDIS